MKKAHSMYRNLIVVLKDLRMDVFSSELLKSALKLTLFIFPFTTLMYCLVYIIQNFSDMNQILKFASSLVIITLCVFLSILLFLSAFGFCSRLILSLTELKKFNQQTKVYDEKPVAYRNEE